MPKPVGNRILSRLSRADLALLTPHLESVDLPLLMRLETANSRIDTVYFIDNGFASVVADGPGKRDIEVGLIGREGMTGLPIVLGHGRARHTTYMQAAGAGQRISATRLRKAVAESASLQQSLLRCCERVSHPDHRNGARQWPQQERRAFGALAADGGRPH